MPSRRAGCGSRSPPDLTLQDVERRGSPHPLPGVAIHAIGGEQVMLCHVTYEPGTTVRRHSHPTAEQVMWIVDGDVTMTIGDETKTLGAGDVVVVNRGLEHELSPRRDDVRRGARAGATCRIRARSRARRAGRLLHADR